MKKGFSNTGSAAAERKKRTTKSHLWLIADFCFSIQSTHRPIRLWFSLILIVWDGKKDTYIRVQMKCFTLSAL